MFKKWKTVAVTACLSTIMLLGMSSVPQAAELQNGQTTLVAEPTPNTASTTTNTSAKPVTSKKQKSVLDAESLESPFSFFKDISASDEDESEVNVKPSAVVLALKALVATLLSTIM